MRHMRGRRNEIAPAVWKFPVFGYLRSARRAARLNYAGLSYNENKGAHGGASHAGTEKGWAGVMRLGLSAKFTV
ncbi:MAG: hypothetical protein ACJ8G5_03235, partial [Burkholderiales bacterium]